MSARLTDRVLRGLLVVTAQATAGGAADVFGHETAETLRLFAEVQAAHNWVVAERHRRARGRPSCGACREPCKAGREFCSKRCAASGRGKKGASKGSPIRAEDIAEIERANEEERRLRATRA